MSALENVRIESIGSLLTAAEFINPDNTLKPGAYLPVTLHASFLAAIASLRDKVRSTQGETERPPQHHTTVMTVTDVCNLESGRTCLGQVGNPELPPLPRVSIDYVRPAFFDQVTTALYETFRHSLDVRRKLRASPSCVVIPARANLCVEAKQRIRVWRLPN